MVADRQVHALPDRTAELERFATFMGYGTAAAFAAALLRQLGRVRARYAEVFERIPADAEEDVAGLELDFRGDDPSPAGTVAALRGLGFENTGRIITAVRGWQAGRLRALRSERARDLMRSAAAGAAGRAGEAAGPGPGIQPVRRFPRPAAGGGAIAVAVPAQS